MNTKYMEAYDQVRKGARRVVPESFVRDYEAAIARIERQDTAICAALGELHSILTPDDNRLPPLGKYQDLSDIESTIHNTIAILTAARPEPAAPLTNAERAIDDDDEGRLETLWEGDAPAADTPAHETDDRRALFDDDAPAPPPFVPYRMGRETGRPGRFTEDE